MTPEQLRLVQSTAAWIEDDAEQFSAVFIESLVWTAPEMRRLLPTNPTVLAELRHSFVRELVYLAELASDMPTFVCRTRRLGAINHRRWLRLEHFPAAEHALVAALKCTVGDALTPEAERGWRRLYRLITETMLEGAASEQFGQRQC